MCLLLLCIPPRLVCGVMYSVFVRRFAAAALRVRNDDDRFDKQLNTLTNYYYKYFNLSLNAF